MTFEILVAFIMFATVSAITPGPNNMMVMASGLNYGFRRTVPHIMGVTIGFGLMVFLAGLGLLSVLDYVPFLYNFLHIACVIYLLYLAWKIATASPLDSSKVTQQKPFTFLQGAAFQWVNPKAIVMSIAAITNYVPEENFFFNVVLISVLFASISGPCLAIWGMFGDGFRRFLTNPLHYRIFNITMAILLVLSLYPLLTDIKI